jgi:hypothetical protein
VRLIIFVISPNGSTPPLAWTTQPCLEQAERWGYLQLHPPQLFHLGFHTLPCPPGSNRNHSLCAPFCQGRQIGQISVMLKNWSISRQGTLT